MGEGRLAARLRKQNSRHFSGRFIFPALAIRKPGMRVDLATPMKTHSLYLLALAGGAVLFALATPQPLSGQDAQAPSVAAPAIKIETTAEMSPQVVALVNELTAQNKQLSANQAALDEKIDLIAEDVRQARLFAARAGRGGK